MSVRRVVITGLGVVSSLGIGKDDFWSSLIQGKSGISKITAFDTTDYPSHFGGEIRNFNPEKFLSKHKIKMLGKCSQFSLIAAELALCDARLTSKEVAKEKACVCIGTTMGENQVLKVLNESWVSHGAQMIDQELVWGYPHNILGANIGIHFHCTGSNMVFPTACAAGNYSIGYGYDLIRENRGDIIFAGGVDIFSHIAYIGFNRLYAMAPDKCQPFDKNRKGMLLGEGAGMVVLEELEHAKARKAPIYAEVLGYGLSCDAHHMTQPSEAGIAKCMVKAMKESNIKPVDVDYISVHGTGTPQNDKSEVVAIKEVFGAAYKKIPVSALKSMLGHTMGAAAAIEAIACCLSLRDSILPPTINFETPDPECDIDCVPNKARKQKVRVVLNNSYAFGGNNACLTLKKY